MFGKIFLCHLTIVIEADDETIFRMLNQYPTYKRFLEKKLIRVKVHRENKISNDVAGYHEISPGFNVGPNIELRRFRSDKMDIIFRKSLESKLRIDRDFKNWRILCEYSGKLDDCRNFIVAVVETFVTNAIYTLNYIPVHGAVLKNRNMCIALCGGSGVGKSTTALQLLSQGGCLLSNDLFYLDTKMMWVYSLDKTLGMRKNNFPALNNYIEDIKMFAPYLYCTDQKYYDMQVYLKDRYILADRLDAVFFLKKSECKSAFISNNYSFSNFMDCCIFPSDLIDSKTDFIRCYRRIISNCMVSQLEIPNFENIPNERMQSYIVNWNMISDFYTESRWNSVT